jgi:opacity protein-like surface antigen
MSKTFFAVLSLFFFASLASAQIPTKGNVYFGYSYENLDSMSLDFLNQNRASLNGWEATVEGKVLPGVGIVGDFSGHYGTQDYVFESAGLNSPSSVDAHEFTALFGPRVSASVGKFRPFAEFLFGAGHISETVNSSLAANLAQSDTAFALAIGGGLDYKVIRPLAWRFQGDYLSAHYFSTSENNVRVSTGIVLRF